MRLWGISSGLGIISGAVQIIVYIIMVAFLCRNDYIIVRAPTSIESLSSGRTLPRFAHHFM